MKKKSTIVFILFLCILEAHAVNKVKRISDVIYDHRDGVALVFDVLIPEGQNGVAVFRIISGGWWSTKAAMYKNEEFKEFTDKGETVFLVSHGSMPRYKVPEIVDQLQRAIRYARYNAEKFGVDPNRFCVMGASSGGHLSVSIGVMGKNALSEEEYRKMYSLKDKDKVDPVNLVSSKVQAIACFFPAVNLIDYNHADSTFADYPNVQIFVEALFPKNTSREEQIKLLKKSSPYFYVTKDTPPILVFHGTEDSLVPYRQAVNFIEKLKENEIPCKLVVKKGYGHGWPYLKTDDQEIITWFETHTAKK